VANKRAAVDNKEQPVKEAKNYERMAAIVKASAEGG
jgi:hypothetical protein